MTASDRFVFRNFGEENRKELKSFFEYKCKMACLDWENCFEQSLDMVFSQWEKKPPKEWSVYTYKQRLDYLKSAIVNKAITIWEKCRDCQLNSKFVAIDDPETNTDLIDDSSYICPYQNALNNEIYEIINDECTEEQKIILDFFAEGTSSREIGNQLNKSANNVRKIIERVLKKLRKKISLENPD